MKTIRLGKNGTLKESMSFENIDYQEIHDNDKWYESRLYEIFSNKFLFVIYKATGNDIIINGKIEEEYVFHKAMFWNMPTGDLNIAEKYWENIRSNVLHNMIDKRFFWKIKDHHLFHVRPKGKDSKDLAINPNGGQCPKYCYWFNAKYVKKIISED